MLQEATVVRRPLAQRVCMPAMRVCVHVCHAPKIIAFAWLATLQRKP